VLHKNVYTVQNGAKSLTMNKALNVERAGDGQKKGEKAPAFKQPEKEVPISCGKLPSGKKK